MSNSWKIEEVFVVYENNKADIKAYGAGLLSSFGEIEYACGSSKSSSSNSGSNSSNSSSGSIEEYNDNHNNKTNNDDKNEIVDDINNNNSKKRKYPKLLSWDPQIASVMSFPITEYQPTYFIAER